jgi:hypothetical protein
MMRIIRNIGLIFIVSVLILATGGFSIYHHVCHCVGEISASIFLEASCDHENTSASCCSADENHSCCMEKPPTDSKHACHDGDCCNTSIQFLKISDSFQPGLEKISLKPLVLASDLVFVSVQEDVHLIPTFNIYSADLPPPDSGKQILVALHQLKLDPHLV